jgi:hypothetical protein
MATLQQIQDFATGNQQLRQRFLAGRLQVAWNIMGENPPVAGRVAWAKKIFENYDGDADAEYLHFLSHSSIQTSGNAITDAQIVTAITSFISEWIA